MQNNIHTTAPSRKIIVKRGIHGAQSHISIINDSEESFLSNEIIIEVDAPKGVFVEIGQAIEARPGVFKPQLELKPYQRIQLPVIIERSDKVKIQDAEINIATYAEDSKIGESRLRIDS